ncbi:hypothetical protein NL108_015453 [Boleophthalmus pectinirostris]|nr:hypothetical protein NL108_015453 [Boleophthalmus pectinirostris]
MLSGKIKFAYLQFIPATTGLEEIKNGPILLTFVRFKSCFNVVTSSKTSGVVFCFIHTFESFISLSTSAKLKMLCSTLVSFQVNSYIFVKIGNSRAEIIQKIPVKVCGI